MEMESISDHPLSVDSLHCCYRFRNPKPSFHLFPRISKTQRDSIVQMDSPVAEMWRLVRRRHRFLSPTTIRHIQIRRSSFLGILCASWSLLCYFSALASALAFVSVPILTASSSSVQEEQKIQGVHKVSREKIEV